MKEITVSAKTVDDAITEASIQLGVSSDQMEYDVIEKGSAGFFGIGSKQAVIRARLKKVEEPVYEEVVKAEEKKVEEKRPEERKYQERRHSDKKHHDKKHVDKHVEKTEKKELKKEVKEEKAVETVAEPKKEIEITVVTEETMKICEEFLMDVLRAMGMEAVEVDSKIDEDGALSIELKGDNMGILIGKRGQTLDSLQYLTNRVANKSQDGYVRVKLDTEDYRRRRKQTLENLAKNIAYKVKRSRKAVALEPMNPYERRIIHSALQGDERVSTHSEGEEPYRRVVITPNRR
ncbi:MAG: protein jag [bacterium]|nr:protein jag [bacterium]